MAVTLTMQEMLSRRRYHVAAEEALCIVLQLLLSLSRWRNIEAMFGRSACLRSQVFFETVEGLLGRCGACVTTWRRDLMEGRAARYAICVTEREAPQDKFIGFIDGTGIPVARCGGGLHRGMYSGHKKDHFMNAQFVVTAVVAQRAHPQGGGRTYRVPGCP